MRTKIFNLIIFCFFIQFATAQDKGTVIFDVAPLQAYIKINNQILRPADIGAPKTTIDLKSGTYKVQIWAYGMKPYSEDIIVQPNKDVKVAVGLEPKDEFITYKNELNEYETNRRVEIQNQMPMIVTSSSLTLGTLTYAGVSIVRLNKLQNTMETLRTSYETTFAPNRIDNLEREYYENRDKYDRSRGSFYAITTTGTLISLTSWGYTYFRFKNGMEKFPKPFFEDSNPFTNVTIDVKMETTEYANSFTALSFIYKF